MDFARARKEFERLEYLRQTGHLTEEQYRAQLASLRVTDQWGRVWMPQERTGQWHLWHQGQWVPATPPGAAMPAAPAPTGSAPMATPQSRARKPQTGTYIVILLVFWGLVAAVVGIFVAPGQPAALAGVAAAAALSTILTISSLGGQWEGQVIEIRVEREAQHDDDGVSWEDVTYAYVRQPSGKVRKIRAMPGWQVGDYLRKTRGQMDVRKV